MKQLIFLLLPFIVSQFVLPQTGFSQIPVPDVVQKSHPRLVPDGICKSLIFSKFDNSEELKADYVKFKESVSKYVEQYQTDPEWLACRLQMYWKTNATDIYVKGPVFSHAEGHAPVPTVRFTGARDHTTIYKRPKLEDVKPYMDDPRGLWLQNSSSADQEWEWAHPSKTGRIIESINREIMTVAKKAAIIYWLEGDERYAKLTFHLFDVFMQGIYYRNVPYDMNHGHIQTLVGYTSFEVIHEDILNELVPCYDFLYDYIATTKSDKLEIYNVTFKKFADQIIKNGVPFNNWNLIQTDFAIQIALMLDNDSDYEDGKGCQYYLDQVFNKSAVRQWSLTDLMNYGYDEKSAVWKESPGYSMVVANHFTHIITLVQNGLNMDIVPYLPLIPKAVKTLPQYLFPNGFYVGFGDTHYNKLAIGPMMELIKNAQKFGKRDQEIVFTGLAKIINPNLSNENKHKDNSFLSILYNKEIQIDNQIKATGREDLITPTFFAPNVSWLVQRSGLDEKHDLMISMAGSLGNHMHSNGIAIELYGKGYVLAPESGIGTSYFQQDYAEYYSQFPAHNTIVVDGVSRYPEMKSDHGFEMKSMYPLSGKKEGVFPGFTFAEVDFLEPETNADQKRVMGIIRIGDEGGYYIDIFRSKRRNGNDKYHDYFYHNLGEELNLYNENNQELKLTETDQLSFAEGSLMAYDYLWDKKSVKTDKNFKAVFKVSIDEEDPIKMNMWMTGEKEREVFKVLSPPSEAFRKEMIPESVSKAPLPTIIVRQSGEAWSQPFVAVYEPATGSEPEKIVSVTSIKLNEKSEGFEGLKVELKNNRCDYILSNDQCKTVLFSDILMNGTYGVISTKPDELTMFLGNGTSMKKGLYELHISKEYKSGSAGVVFTHDGLYISSDQSCNIIIPTSYKNGNMKLVSSAHQYRAFRKRINGKMVLQFTLPQTGYEFFRIVNE